MPRETLGSNAGGNKAITQLGRAPSLDEIFAFSQTNSGQEKTRQIIFSHGVPTYSADPENPSLLLERSAMEPSGGASLRAASSFPMA